jgi:hypothetical protein
VLFNHSLEHIGQNSRTFLGMMKELYRVCKDQARIEIHVPHPRHDDFINDPTHVRIITPGMFGLFDRKSNDEMQRLGGANTPLARYLGVDFLEHGVMVLDEPMLLSMPRNCSPNADVELMSREWNNVSPRAEVIPRRKKDGINFSAGARASSTILMTTKQ